MAKLTKSFIDRVEIPTNSFQIHWDDTLKGYGLRVSSVGKKVFIAMGRLHGRNVSITIGPFGQYTEAEARDKARRVLLDLREGKDPRDAKKHEEAIKITLREVADAYMARPGKLKESSKSEIDRHVKTTFSAWENKPIIGISEEDCRKRYNEMLTKGLRGKAPAPGQANQAFSVLRALINFASRRYKKGDGTPIIINNPVSALKDDWVELKPRTNVIDTSKVGAVWNKLHEWRTTAHNRDTLASIDLIIFLLLTGARIGEASSTRWENINLEEGWWYIPDPKNNNSVWIPLSTQAIQLLETRQRIEGSPFVFTSWSECGHIKDPRDSMKKLSLVAGKNIACHDLRRTFITLGVTVCKIDLYRMELLTNHVPKGVTARHYLETSRLQYLQPETQIIADWIDKQGRLANEIELKVVA